MGAPPQVICGAWLRHFARKKNIMFYKGGTILYVDQYYESPWYNHTGWLGVKHQFTYNLMSIFLDEQNENESNIYGVVFSFCLGR